MCLGDLLVNLACPGGLLFDTKAKKCNYANATICDELKIVTTTLTTTTTTTIATTSMQSKFE